MDYKYIEQLLEKYWNCQTSLEEEHILRTFFAQKDIPESLKVYKDVFNYEHAEPIQDTLGSDFDARMMKLVEEPVYVKARTISLTQRLKPLFKAAAVVAIILTLGNAAQITFTDDTQQMNVSGLMKARHGASVAMEDSMKMDSAKQAPATATLK